MSSVSSWCWITWKPCCRKGISRGVIAPVTRGMGKCCNGWAKPASLVLLEETHSRVRALRLVGLDADAGAQLLAEKGVVGTPQERARLVETYAGNPLALKVVTETISDLFAVGVGPFLRQSLVILGSSG